MSKKTRFIGDIHGNYIPWIAAAENSMRSVQVGDFGLGFGTKGLAAFVDSVVIDPIPGEHRFIRGNHDALYECKLSKNWIPDGTIEGPVMYIGGAGSIDRAWRTEGLNWWSDEELSISELDQMIETYAQAKPKVLVTHDCSEQFAKRVMMPLVNSTIDFPSRTRDAIDQMYLVKPPEVHIFGHWHHRVDYIDEQTGTRMICLGIDEYIDIDLEIFE